LTAEGGRLCSAGRGNFVVEFRLGPSLEGRDLGESSFTAYQSGRAAAEEFEEGFRKDFWEERGQGFGRVRGEDCFVVRLRWRGREGEEVASVVAGVALV